MAPCSDPYNNTMARPAAVGALAFRESPLMFQRPKNRAPAAAPYAVPRPCGPPIAPATSAITRESKCPASLFMSSPRDCFEAGDCIRSDTTSQENVGAAWREARRTSREVDDEVSGESVRAHVHE